MSADPFSFSDEDEAVHGVPDLFGAGPNAGGFGYDEQALGAAPTVYEPVALPPATPTQYVTETPPVHGEDLPGWERRRRVRLQARKVRRIIRHIEPWSVLKISVIFYLCLWVIFVVAGVMLWSVATSSGTVETVETTVVSLFALEEFEIDANIIFRGYALGGLVLATAGAAFNVLLCVLFNLISDLVGGIRITVIEEESARFRPPRRRPARR